MNINKEIEKITNRYGLNIQGKTFQERIEEALVEMFEELFEEKKVAIKGGGEHTENLLRLIELSGNIGRIQGIYDRKYKEAGGVLIGDKELVGYPDADLSRCKANTVIASSYLHRREIASEIKKFNSELEVYDIYDELEKRGLIVNFLFYRADEKGYESLLYYRNVYLENRDQESLWNYLVACITICDFIHFRENAEKYIQNAWAHSEDLKSAVEEFDELFRLIKTKLKERKQRDILMLWLDQLEYGELDLCPFIKQEAEQSMFLENAFTVAPFTAATMYAIFLKERSLDDRFYINGKKDLIITPDNSSLLKVIEKSGYDFTYIGDNEDANLFRDEDKIPNYTWGTSMIRCLELLQKLLDSQRPVFVILHELVETHSPYLSGELDHARMIAWPDVAEEVRAAQIKQSALFWDHQWEWYNAFLNDSIVKIYMSDHGKRHGTLPLYKDLTSHVLTFVKGPGVPVKKLRKTFTLYNFDKLADAVLHSIYEEDAFCTDYIELQEAATFNDAAVKFYVESHAEDSAKPYRAIRTATELYAKLSTGEQFYYLLPDEDTDHSSEPEYAERIQELSKLAGDYFWSFDGYEDRLKFFRKRLENHE